MGLSAAGCPAAVVAEIRVWQSRQWGAGGDFAQAVTGAGETGGCQPK